jgi:hypothetical protein
LFAATTGCAAALAIGRSLSEGNPEVWWAGAGFAFLLAAGLLAAVKVWCSRVVVVASLFSLGVGLAGFSILPANELGDVTTLTVAASTTCFVCAHLRLAGYVARRMPRTTAS